MAPAAGNPKRLILASASPRRLALLRQIGLEPDNVIAADIDERARRQERAVDLVRRLAGAKARHVAASAGGAFVLAADTVVACGRRILPKAEDEGTAQRCLELLSGRRHRVLTGVALVAPDGRLAAREAVSTVTFKRLTADEIAWYLAGGDWKGKAGGYAIQGPAALFVRFLSGSHSNVVGLPLYETGALLAGLGFPVALPPCR